MTEPTDPAAPIPPFDDAGPWAYQNWRAHEQGGGESLTQEYALYSDAWFTGHWRVETSPYQVLNMIATSERDRVARAALTLRIAVHESAPVDKITEKVMAMGAAAELARKGKGPKPKTDNTRYHGGDLPDEIAALVSLALGVRVAAGELTREFYPNQDPKGMPVAHQPRFVRPLLAKSTRPVVPALLGQRPLDLELLLTYPRIPATDAILLLRAARSYQEAAWIAEGDPESAWILLVSATETAANQWWAVRDASRDLTPSEVLEGAKPEVVEILRAHDDTGELLARVAEVISPLFQSRQKFLQFFESFAPPAPEPRPPAHVAIQWEWKSLRKSLDSVYTHRSNALHAGLPFPPAMSEAPFPCDAPEGEPTPVAERPWAGMGYAKGGFWTGSESPMLLNTFAHIVHGSLLNWWRWLAER